MWSEHVLFFFFFLNLISNQSENPALPFFLHLLHLEAQISSLAKSVWIQFLSLLYERNIPSSPVLLSVPMIQVWATPQGFHYSLLHNLVQVLKKSIAAVAIEYPASWWRIQRSSRCLEFESEFESTQRPHLLSATWIICDTNQLCFPLCWTAPQNNMKVLWVQNQRNKNNCLICSHHIVSSSLGSVCSDASQPHWPLFELVARVSHARSKWSSLLAVVHGFARRHAKNSVLWVWRVWKKT